MDFKGGKSFLLSRHVIASLASSDGNWRHIQSTNDSKSFAKSSRYQSISFGIAITFLMVEMPTAACKYSLLAVSSSLSTRDAVYTLTFNNGKRNQTKINKIAESQFKYKLSYNWARKNMERPLTLFVRQDGWWKEQHNDDLRGHLLFMIDKIHDWV